MPIIVLKTEIKADREMVFDLSRSIELHQISTAHTGERVVGEKKTGLIGLDESVTWRARHFGLYHNLTSKITELDKPRLFTDEMVSGAFKKFRHEHIFKDVGGGTLMIDIFDYESPFGLLGRWADCLILESYMAKLLCTRNTILKQIAESDKWKEILPFSGR